MRHYLRLLRPLDWIKNSFVFAPLFFTPHLVTMETVSIVFLAFLIFCLAASSIYILNDVVDYEFDRLHEHKMNRPIASDQVSLSRAKILFVALSLVSLIAAYYLQWAFFISVLVYYVLNIAYCVYFRAVSIIDICIIAAGFVIRVCAGAFIIQVFPSEWLLLCTGLLALFLGLGKRRDDVVRNMNALHRKSLQGYNLPFIDASITVVLSALFIAYMTYSTLESTVLHLGTKHFYYTVPIVLIGIFRYLQITLVEQRSGSPTELLCKDRVLSSIVLCWILLTVLLVYWL